MSQADFAYAPANDAAGANLAVSIFADRAWLREELQGDVVAAGLSLRSSMAMRARLARSC